MKFSQFPSKTAQLYFNSDEFKRKAGKALEKAGRKLKSSFKEVKSSMIDEKTMLVEEYRDVSNIYFDQTKQTEAFNSIITSLRMTLDTYMLAKSQFEIQKGSLYLIINDIIAVPLITRRGTKDYPAKMISIVIFRQSNADKTQMQLYLRHSYDFGDKKIKDQAHDRFREMRNKIATAAEMAIAQTAMDIPIQMTAPTDDWVKLSPPDILEKTAKSPLRSLYLAAWHNGKKWEFFSSKNRAEVTELLGELEQMPKKFIHYLLHDPLSAGDTIHLRYLATTDDLEDYCIRINSDPAGFEDYEHLSWTYSDD